MTFLPPGFTDDGSCIFDGVDNNGDGIPDNSMQGCEDATGYYNYNFISSPFAMNPSSYINTYADQQNEICIPFSIGCTDTQKLVIIILMLMLMMFQILVFYLQVVRHALVKQTAQVL